MHEIIENLFEVINNPHSEIEEFRFALSGVHYLAANIDEVNEAGESVLFAAILSGNEFMVREIINAGANPALVTMNDDTILHYIAQYNNDGKPVPNDLVDYIETTLLGYCELAQRNHTGQTALEVANANRNESIIAILSQEEDAEFVGAVGPADMIEFGGVIHPSEWSDYGIESM